MITGMRTETSEGMRADTADNRNGTDTGKRNGEVFKSVKMYTSYMAVLLQ